MPRNGSGTYALPNVAQDDGNIITADLWNANFDDVKDALSESLARDGQTPATADLPMGGYKHTGVEDGTARTHYASIGQMQDGGPMWGGTAGGTANALTVTLAPAITAYATGQAVQFITGASANSGAMTLAINGLTAKAIVRPNGSTALAAGDVPAGTMATVIYDGTSFRLVGGFGVVWLLGGNSYTGEQNLQDNLLTRPLIKDYAVKHNARGSVSGAQTIDLTLGNYASVTASGNITFTFSNPAASPDASGFILALTNGGAFTITWPASVDWPGGIAPTLIAAGVDVLAFITADAGTTWRGALSMADSK